MLKIFIWIISLLCWLGFSCSSAKDTRTNSPRKLNEKVDYITRLHHESLFISPEPQFNHRDPYFWEQNLIGNHSRITKEFFRCKGSSLNPAKLIQKGSSHIRYYDCGGTHGLPLREGREFIYPILINLLNYVQSKTGRKVIITSGHRCPEHNAYVDSSIENQSSKHLIGAEVSFYVQGIEEFPEKLIPILQNYYKETPIYQKKLEFVEFERYEKEDLRLLTHPWMNKEIFIKIFKKNEGRNHDNRHFYPYLSIQVRYDFEREEKVKYSREAEQKYLRK